LNGGGERAPGAKLAFAKAVASLDAKVADASSRHLEALLAAGLFPAAEALVEADAPRTPSRWSATSLAAIAKRRPADPALWPITPTAGYGGWSKTTGSTWLGSHTKLEAVAAACPSAEILLLGDALPTTLGNGLEATPTPPASWKKYIGSRQVLNLAQPGENTEQVLWRLKCAFIDHLSPRVVIIGVGANNLVAVERHKVPVAAIAKGIETVISTVRSHWPNVTVVVIEPLLMGRPKPAQRENLAALQTAIDALPRIPGVTFVNPRGLLADDAGVIRTDLSGYGGLLLNDAGREALGAALAAALKGQP
jgi:lysophospholipase L1-like esterase